MSVHKSETDLWSIKYFVFGTWIRSGERLTVNGPAPSVSAFGRSTSPKFASLKGEETGSCFSLRERSECWGEYRRRRGGGSCRLTGTWYLVPGTWTRNGLRIAVWRIAD